MYNKNNLLVHKIASKSSIKPELKSVAFMGDRTIATDSFRVIEMSVPDGQVEETVLIDADVVGKFKSVPKIFNEVAGELQKVEAMYPDTDEVFKRHENRKDTVTIKINAEYVEQICSIMKHLSKFKDVELTIAKDDPTAAVVFKAGNDKQKARALVMPMNKG